MVRASTRRNVQGSARGAGERTAAAHADGDATRDPRAVLGNRASRMVLVQPKLVVGSSHDPLEIEADRVAADVVRAIASAPVAASGEHGHADDSAVHRSGPAAAGTISRAPDHRCGDGCAVHGRQGPIVQTIRRHAGHGHHDHHDEPMGAAGGDVHAADERAVHRARGGGAALPAAFRSQVEPIMGADFSGVRVHTGGAAAQLNRSFGASAFTIGRDIFFRDGMPDVGTRDGAHLVTHELTHTIQQGGTPSVARCACGATNPRIQRHSSFEHLMLGNVKPTELATIGAWKDAIDQTKRPGLMKSRATETAQVNVNLPSGPIQISKGNILHVLMQEMKRLKAWQAEAPKESSAEQSNKVGASLVQMGKDTTFEAVTVMLPQGIMCTYGEMNTLADYFGSVDVLKGADARAVWQLLQSVRSETWGFLRSTFEKVSDSMTSTERRNADKTTQDAHADYDDLVAIPTLLGEDPDAFEGAMAFRVSGMGGQLELLKGVQSTGAQGDTNKYMPSLGRNACHFVPESWHAWAKNHNDAINLARQSFAKYQESEQAKTLAAAAQGPVARQLAAADFEEKKARSVELANDALLTNGFGDHFLQDSYAAGHMINKSQIMQWYVEYIDSKNQWDYFKDANWQKAQNIAYNQTLAPAAQYDPARIEGNNGATGANANKGMDPQAVENRGNTWQQNFTDLGLKVPRSLDSDPTSATRRLLQQMRILARNGRDALKGDAVISEMKKMGFNNVGQVRMAVADMLLDGVLLADVDVAKRGRQMASMRDKRASADANPAAQVTDGAGESLTLAAFRKGTYKLRPELRPKKGSAAKPMTEAERQEEFQAITFNDYLEFIQSSFLQKSTNALHDTFCKGGLTVYDNNNAQIGVVYGDDAMFSANSSMGVAHSGETSQRSRDSILEILNTGTEGAYTTNSIVDRFPTKVRADVYNGKGKVVVPGVAMDFAAWHDPSQVNNLKAEANRRIFPSMDWGVTQKLAPGVLGPELGNFFTSPPPHVPF